MTHFGIICPPSPGHLNPMTTLGFELQQSGHRVTVIGVEDARAKAEAAGLEFAAIAQAEYPLGFTKEVFAKLGSLTGIRAMKFTIDSINRGAKIILDYVPEIVKNQSIEVLLVDQATCEGGTVAEHCQIPFISMCSAIMLNKELAVPPCVTSWQYNPSWIGLLRNYLAYSVMGLGRRPLLKTINSYRRKWRLQPYLNIDQTYSQLAQICQQPAEFEFPRNELPSNFYFTGSFNNPQSRESADFPYDKLTGQPLIYASLGTLQNRLLGIFENMIEACRELDVQLVIALGGGLQPESLVKSAEGTNTIVVGYAPQLDLLQKADLTITHAGMNTALESLSSGVPMVAIPITNDQPAVAARIVWTGTGEAIAPGEVTPQKLREKIQQVLSNHAYKKNALDLQQAMQKAGGAKRAVDIIEQALAN